MVGIRRRAESLDSSCLEKFSDHSRYNASIEDTLVIQELHRLRADVGFLLSLADHNTEASLERMQDIIDESIDDAMLKMMKPYRQSRPDQLWDDVMTISRTMPRMKERHWYTKRTI